MSMWDEYPADYRAAEVQAVRAAVKSGECVAVVGLSGAGKSNLLGFLAARQPGGDHPRYVLVDGNRVAEPTAAGFLSLMQQALRQAIPGPEADRQAGEALSNLDGAIETRLANRLCFLLDLSLLVNRDGGPFAGGSQVLWGQLRALRDRHKFALTYVAATRHALPPDNELAELFFGHTLWLGALGENDGRWNVQRYAARTGQEWNASQVEAILTASGGYPALVRGVCEACASGVAPTLDVLARHPAVAARVDEFWADRPDDGELRAAKLDSVALLMQGRPRPLDPAGLTAKEHRLLQAFQARPGEVYEKDDLIRAVWPEDKVLVSGVRDDSLAQLVRRLREKIEADASHPRYIQTVPGRGYRFVKRFSEDA